MKLRTFCPEGSEGCPVDAYLHTERELFMLTIGYGWIFDCDGSEKN